MARKFKLIGETTPEKKRKSVGILMPKFCIFFRNSIYYLFVHLMCVNNMTIKVCCIDDIVISRCVIGETKNEAGHYNGFGFDTI